MSDFITEIPDEAFMGCTSLTDIICPGITSIGNNAFAGCINLSKFEISDGVESIGQGAFGGVKEISIKAVNYEVIDAIANSGAKSITVDRRS